MLVISDFILIESEPQESDESLRTWLEALFHEIYGSRPDWLKYELGQSYTFRDQRYRQFKCIAGSVSLFIMKQAKEPPGINRSIIYWGKDLKDRIRAVQIVGATEEEVPFSEILEMNA